MNTIEAINALVALTNLATRMAQASQEVSAMLQRAQAENRDLTDAEIAEVHEMRREAMDRWSS